MSYRFEFELIVSRENGAPLTDTEALSASLDEVMDALAELNVVDPFLGGSLAKGTVTIEFGEEGGEHKDDFEALQRAVGTLRTAIHSAGGHTPGWEEINWEIAAARRARDPGLVGT